MVNLRLVLLVIHHAATLKESIKSLCYSWVMVLI